MPTRTAVRSMARRKGHGWYRAFRELGPDAFTRRRGLPPFDWSAPPVLGRPRARGWLEIAVNGKPHGRVELELADDLLPASVAQL